MVRKVWGLQMLEGIEHVHVEWGGEGSNERSVIPVSWLSSNLLAEPEVRLAEQTRGEDEASSETLHPPFSIDGVLIESR